MGKLITTSLLDQIDWYRKCPPDWKQKAHKDLTATLNRELWTPNDSIKRGMDFEAKVMAFLSGTEQQFMDAFDQHCPDVVQFYRLCKGGKPQVSLKKDIVVGGVLYTLYGKSDILFPTTHPNGASILDIKTTVNYKGPKSYLDKNQHLVYAYCTGIAPFTYLVAEISEITETCSAVHKIATTVDIEAAGRHIEDAIKDAIALFEDDQDWLRAYHTKFNRY